MQQQLCNSHTFLNIVGKAKLDGGQRKHLLVTQAVRDILGVVLCRIVGVWCHKKSCFWFRQVGGRSLKVKSTLVCTYLYRLLN